MAIGTYGRYAPAWAGGATEEEVEQEDATAELAADQAADQALRSGVQASADLLKYFNQQCYLMDNHKKYCSEGARPPGYEKFTCLMGDPSDTLQAITSVKGKGGILDMTPDEFSLLVPRIKLFKVPLKPNGKPNYENGQQQEILFRTHYDDFEMSEMTTNRDQRGSGIGLKELTYEFYDAGSKELAARRIKVTLKFYAESLSALSKEPKSGFLAPLELAIDSQKYSYKYDDKGAKIAGKREANSDWFQIKVVYGWAVPSENSDYISIPKKKSLANSVQTLLLNLTDHSLTFNENGSVELEVEYQGSVDTKLDQAQRNILVGGEAKAAALEDMGLELTNLDEILKEKRERLEKLDEEVWEEGFTPRTHTDLEKKRDRLEAEIEALGDGTVLGDKITKMQQVDKAEKYGRIINDLNDSGKIWFVEVSTEAIALLKKEYMYMGKDTTGMSEAEKIKFEKGRAALAKEKAKLKAPTPQRASQGGNVLGDAQRGIQEVGRERSVGESDEVRETVGDMMEGENKASEASTPGSVRINYMYFGDILDVVLNVAYKGKQLPIRYLVGPLNYMDLRDQKRTTINIADIPIAMPLFERFWIHKVVGPQLDSFTVGQFITSAINELIVAALGVDCFVGMNPNADGAHVSFTTVSAQMKQGGKEPIPRGKRIDINAGMLAPTPDDNILSSAAFSHPKESVEYLFIYCYAWTKTGMKEDRTEDELRGIYHIGIGQDRGPVKKISFEKNDIPYQATAKAMESQGGPIAKLAASYNAKVTMLGNTLFMPGNYVYINPTTLGASKMAAKKLGLGGYYTITKLDGKIDSGGWDCDIECLPYGADSNAENSEGGARPGTMPASGDIESGAGHDPEEK